MKTQYRNILLFTGIFLAGILLFFLNVLLGSVSIPAGDVFNIFFGGDVEKASWATIIMDSRLPMALTAVLAGSALSISGLLMQTLFRNPLAGPSVLGVSSGASLGVAMVTLLAGGVLSEMLLINNVSIIIAAFAGAGGVIFVLLFLAPRVGNNIVLLIIGLMIGYAVSSIVNVLQFFSSDHDLQAYILWGLGSFSKVGWQNMVYFSGIVIAGLVAAILLMKPLNMILLGNNYAFNLGLNMRKARLLVISVAGILAAIVTAFCGPIAFIGIAVPHIVRNLFKSNNHRVIVPAVILCGGVFALMVSLLSRLPGSMGALPVNAISSLIGAPIVVWVIFRNRNREVA